MQVSYRLTFKYGNGSRKDTSFSEFVRTSSQGPSGQHAVTSTIGFQALTGVFLHGNRKNNWKRPEKQNETTPDAYIEK